MKNEITWEQFNWAIDDLLGGIKEDRSQLEHKPTYPKCNIKGPHAVAECEYSPQDFCLIKYVKKYD